MRLLNALLLLPALLGAPALASAQTSASAQAPAAAAAIPTASSVLSPALDQISNSFAGVRLDKWKASGSVRQETNANMASISRDLDGTLPPLLAAADGAPASVSQTLPVFQNVDALYDVLLRVTEAADNGAPKRQAAALHDALSSLENARHTLADSLVQAATAQDAQMRGLRAQLRQAATPPPAPVCPEVHETRKPVHHHHPVEHKTAPEQPQHPPQ